MRYNINGRLIYDATDGTLTLLGSDEPDSQLSITASALLCFFLRHTGVISRDEVLKKVWDDNGLTSSASNLNQYLSILRKTFRHYDIDNIIVTVSRGHLQLNPGLDIGLPDPSPAPQPAAAVRQAPESPPGAPSVSREKSVTAAPHTGGICWYSAGVCLLAIALQLVIFCFSGGSESRPVTLTPMRYSQCELLARDGMLHSVTRTLYGRTLTPSRQHFKLACKPGECFVFFYGDRLESNGPGCVFLAHCVGHEDNPFSYCDNYFYAAWMVQ